jgi:hypothetical protein
MIPQRKIIIKVNIIAMIAFFSISLFSWIPFYEFLGISGTGSYPPGWNGWHLTSLLKVSQAPSLTPKRRMDREAYAEQEGVKRQQGPKRIEKVC